MKHEHSKLNLNACLILVSTINALVASVQAVYAEMHSSAYKKMQEAAPEYIHIEVLKVKTEKLTDGINVEIEAKVMAVNRSESNLKAGDIIAIKYVHNTRGLIGPGPIPILEEGKHYPAFLTRTYGNDFYQPTAMGRSFSVVN